MSVADYIKKMVDKEKELQELIKINNSHLFGKKIMIDGIYYKVIAMTFDYDQEIKFDGTTATLEIKPMLVVANNFVNFKTIEMNNEVTKKIMEGEEL